MDDLKKMLADFVASGLVNTKKYHSVDVALSQHHNVFNKQPLELEFEVSVYGASSATGRNLLGTGPTFDAAMNDYKAKWELKDDES